MSWILSLIIFSFIFGYHPSEARDIGERQFPSALVVGSVYCDTCFENNFSKSSHFISGASVVVECNAPNLKPRFCEEVQTNKHGEFKVHLPYKISKHAKKLQGCYVKLISSSEPHCAVTSASTSSSLNLTSRNLGRRHIFSAGCLTFKPVTQPKQCSHKPSTKNSKKLNSAESGNFPPPLEDPLASVIPPIDNLGQFAPIPVLPKLPPLPQLPPLPNLPSLPIFPPVDSSKNSDANLDQKTFGFSPNPFPPLFPTPAPPSIFPRIPSLPSTPGSTPPSFSLIPPFPFQPSPGLPGIPPTAPYSISQKTNP